MSTVPPTREPGEIILNPFGSPLKLYEIHKNALDYGNDGIALIFFNVLFTVLFFLLIVIVVFSNRTCFINKTEMPVIFSFWKRFLLAVYGGLMIFLDMVILFSGHRQYLKTPVLSILTIVTWTIVMATSSLLLGIACISKKRFSAFSYASYVFQAGALTTAIIDRLLTASFGTDLLIYFFMLLILYLFILDIPEIMQSSSIRIKALQKAQESMRERETRVFDKMEFSVVQEENPFSEAIVGSSDEEKQQQQIKTKRKQANATPV